VRAGCRAGVQFAEVAAAAAATAGFAACGRAVRDVSRRAGVGRRAGAVYSRVLIVSRDYGFALGGCIVPSHAFCSPKEEE
jgi:hypothetical protein